ncbi:Transposon Tf2-1 polyprotein [Sparassis crispa]|uniref:Transposon Tf2-1 polyprotein n=1 Tax=Sparassis crispa TaxID=139825 RepID=A0A401GUD8_9APHY|nr:Transposon Tf2-1 polyprotein [Sparassis crispa]GBE85803.1 Transposon Tf2-1 polyprotein [Sparassis crispa]
MSNNTNMASVTQSSSKNPPILTAGKITPAVAHAWENACLQYFKHNDMANEKKVSKVTGGFQDPIVSDWYYNDADTFDAMSFKDFLILFRARFLPKGWDSAVLTQLLRSRQWEDESFEDWVLSIEKLNTVLRGTLSHLDDTRLRVQIATSICEDLRFACEDEDTIASFKDWKDKVLQVDTVCMHERAHILRITGAINKPKSATTAPTNRGTSNTKSPRLPGLTDGELKLLRDNDGCFKCRKFFIPKEQRGRDKCTNDFPDAAMYCTLTQADVDAAKHNKENTRPRTAVAAVTKIPDDTVYSVGAVNLESEPLAATTEILGTGSASESEYVPSPLTPFTVQHIPWSSIIHGTSSDSVLLPMLIDSGSPAVLIGSELVTRLGLHHRKLPQAFPLGDVWGTESKDSLEWVKLHVSTEDASWTSRTCRAIVVLNCCYPVIVGRPFLKSNRLIVDHELDTVVDKSFGRDICKPAPPPHLPIQRQLDTRETIPVATRPDTTALLRELEQCTQQHLINCEVTSTDAIATVQAIRQRAEDLAYQGSLKSHNTAMKHEFHDLFPDDIPHLNDLPTNIYHRFTLKDPNMVIQHRQYTCPKKYREAWKHLLDGHLSAGCMRPSDSPYASPAFLIPNADPTALPRWVNDYCALNANTVPDMHPLPLISDILTDCAKGKIWGKIDMTNSFFQTRVHPDDVKFTAVTTPFGLYEWLVMPQGCCNAPSTHKHQMFAALRPLIGKICHVYLDDIVIWSQSLEEHILNVRTILQALHKNHLYCSDKKTSLFLTELSFLGHCISSKGIEADLQKVEKILNWSVPCNASQVCAFLGLVRYIAPFLPKLADLTLVLNPLTTKEAELNFPTWDTKHQTTFDNIKSLVCSREVLTVIDHDNMGDNHIFVSCC